MGEVIDVTSPDVADDKGADDEGPNVADVDACFLSSEEDNQIDVLEQVDKANQKEREKMKQKLAAKKAAAAADREAKKKEALARKLGKQKPPNPTPALKVGMRVCGRWNESGPEHGLWFDGTIVSICTSKKTVHIKFDDGDEDDNLSWDHVSIIEDG